MQEEKLCVKWNGDLQERLHTSFGKLREDNDFTDVTLACGEKSIKAHKVILAASSPFFSKLLQAHPHPQPLVYMRGVKAEDLSAMVDFIYLGEANILQRNLERFLAFAEELELQGISDGDEHDLRSEAAVEYRTTVAALREEYLEKTHQRRARDMKKDSSETFSPKIKQEEEDRKLEEKAKTIQKREKQTIPIDPETRATIDSMIKRQEDGLYTCTECDYTSMISGHMKEHVEKHIQGLEYPCRSCDKVLGSSTGWRKHKRSHSNN